jgi:RNA polymerase sigma-70 factor (ECF subfamily)
MDPAAVYRAESDALFRYLVRMTGDSDLAADVLQETFLRLVKRPPATAENLRGWLFRVATNRLRDHARRVRREKVLVTRGTGSKVLPDPPPGPDSLVAFGEQRSAVQRALDALPLRDRTVILMREEGFRHREIAEVVGTTTGSVGTIIARALDRVRKELEAYHG